MNNIINEIHEWAESKSFNQLNGSQQEIVIQQMTAEEYSELYESNQAMTLFLVEEQENMVPNTERFNALKKIALKKENKPNILSFWSKPVPLYSTIAASLFFFAVSFALFSRNSGTYIPQTEDKSLVQVMRDTIYIVEKPTDTIVQMVYLPSPKQISIQNIKTNYNPDESILVKEIAPVPDINTIQKSFGNSSVELARLEQFKVPM